MKTLRALTKSSLFLLLPIAGSWVTVGDTQDCRKGGQVLRVVLETGWSIPGLQHARVVAGRQPFEGEAAKEARVFRKILRAEEEVIAELPYYVLSLHPQVLTVGSDAVSVMEIELYEDERGRPFCYSIEAVKRNYDPKTGAGGYGPKWQLRYYDLDGDETFETLTINSPLEIPAWVKDGDPE